MHRHDGRRAEQPPERDLVADLLARRGDQAHGGRLGVDHADGSFVRDDAGNVPAFFVVISFV